MAAMMRYSEREREEERYSEREREKERSSWRAYEVEREAEEERTLLRLPEMVRSCNQLREMIKAVIQELEEEKRLRLRYGHQEREMIRQRNAQEVIIVERSKEHCIFVYGRHAVRIDAVVQDVVKHAVSAEARGMAKITINGRKLGGYSSKERFRVILATEYIRYSNSDRVIIILEEFTSSMYFNFVTANRLIRREVENIIICWSSQCDQVGDIKGEFARKVFVPSTAEDDPENPSGRKDMPVHKTARPKSTSGLETIYTNAKMSPRDAPQKTENQEKRQIAKMAETLVGSYAEVHHPPSVSRANDQATDGNAGGAGRDSCLGRPETVTPVISNPAGSNSSSATQYTQVLPVRKEQNPPQVVIIDQPRRFQQAPGLGQQTVFWSKQKAESVSVEMHGNQHQDDRIYKNKQNRYDEGNRHEGACDRVTNCIIGAYACLFD